MTHVVHSKSHHDLLTTDIKHGLSIVTCFLGGVGVVVANNSGLMDMLEAQNTLVSILNPKVLTCCPAKVCCCQELVHPRYTAKALGAGKESIPSRLLVAKSPF